MLEVSGAVVRYGTATAVSGVSLTVGRGECVALLGANGSGKSSLVKAVLGLVPLAAGEVRLAGRSLNGVPVHQRVRAGLAVVPEGRELFPALTVWENLRVGFHGVRERGAWRARLDEVFSIFPQLSGMAQRAGGLLSGGEQQMVAIGRALVRRPRVLLLDEPSLGLAPRTAGQIFDALARIANSGTAVLLIEQDSMRALSLCRRYYLLSGGRIVEHRSHDGDRDVAVLAGVYLGDRETAPERTDSARRTNAIASTARSLRTAHPAGPVKGNNHE